MIGSPILAGLLARARGFIPAVGGRAKFKIAQSLVSEVALPSSAVVGANNEFGNAEIFPICALFITDKKM